MKKFKAFRFFFGLLFLVGLLLYAGISVYAEGASLSTKLAHLTVQLMLATPVCFVVTRLRAMRCGLGFLPQFEIKQEPTLEIQPNMSWLEQQMLKNKKERKINKNRNRETHQTEIGMWHDSSGHF